MKTVLMADPVRYPRMNTDELRDTFLLCALCEPGQLLLNYVDLDRAVVGFASPLEAPIALPTDPGLRATYFTERLSSARSISAAPASSPSKARPSNSITSTSSTSVAATSRSPSPQKTKPRLPSTTF